MPDYTSLILACNDPHATICKYMEEHHQLHLCRSRIESFAYDDVVTRMQTGYDMYKYCYHTTKRERIHMRLSQDMRKLLITHVAKDKTCHSFRSKTATVSLKQVIGVLLGPQTTTMKYR
jgi:hypothetical protein